MEKSRKPKIRFKGYNDDWEQREFDEVFVEKRDKTERENEDTLLSCAINGIYLNSELFGHFRGATTIGYLKVNKNDLILSAQNLHLGNANVNLRFEHGIISPAYKVYDLVDCDPYFVHSWVKKDSTKNFFLCATTEGASQCRKNIEWHTLEKQTILMPVIQEQNLIGNYFQALDELITLHQRKLDKLINVKKSMLEKMFPKQGSTVPEIRFNGFTQAWEQRKLGNIGQTYTGLSGKTKDDFGHGYAQFVTYMNVFSNPISNPKMNEPIEVDSKQNEVEVGDVFFTTSSETPKEVGMTSVLIEKQGEMYLNSFCFGYRLYEKYDSYYLAYMLRSNSFRKKIIMLAQGISRYNISKNKVMEIDIFIPSYKEQMEIGKYFRDLDTLITLHQRKLEKLKNIKKSMLEKMFV